MGVASQTPEESRYQQHLEPELHEGDGRLPAWMWVILAAVMATAAVVAPFQLFWPNAG